MKNDFLTLISVLFLLAMGIIAPIQAQDDKKLKVYVKNFTYNNVILERISENLTSEFETELVKSGIYEVLERNRFDRLKKAMETEKKINDVRGIDSAAIDSLKAYNAEALFFGDVEYYSDDGRCKVTITLQNIYQGNNIKKDHITIVLGDLKNPKLRGDFVKALLNKLHAKEAVSLKEEQLNIIEGKLSTYRARVKEVIDVFEEKIDYLLIMSNTELIPHLDEIEQKRIAFNEIWNDLNANKVEYTKNFSKHWGDDSRIALEYVYSETMEDFHPEFKSYINYLLTRINEHRKADFRNKKKRKEAKSKLAQEIKRELLKVIDEDYYTDVDKKINSFLNALRAEIIKELKGIN